MAHEFITPKYIDTFSGRRLNPFEPEPDQIVIGDIAHALSMISRFGGHGTHFYSVAEHSVYVSYLVPAEDAQWGLIHDATEAYLGDVVRPVKYLEGMEAYRSAENILEKIIAKKFGLPYPKPASIKLADTALLIYERTKFLQSYFGTYDGDLTLELQHLLPSEAEALFLTRFHELFIDTP